MTIDKAFSECPELSPEDAALISDIGESLPVVADLSRADALIYCRGEGAQLVIVAETKP